MSQLSTNTSDEEATRILISRILLGVHTCMPGVIVSLNLDGNVPTASVRPAIQQVETIGNAAPKFVDLPVIDNVPLVLPYAQKMGMVVTLPISPGDECMLHFAERSIDHWQESGGVQPPVERNVPRKHDYRDAICVPGAISKIHPIANYSLDAIEVRNASGAVALSVSNDAAEMRAGAQSIFMPGDGNIYIVGNIIQTGQHTASVGFATPGFIAAALATIGGILFGSHKHTGVQTGSGTSGGPTS